MGDGVVEIVLAVLWNDSPKYIIEKYSRKHSHRKFPCPYECENLVHYLLLVCKISKNIAFVAIIYVLFTFYVVFLAHKVWSIENKSVLLHPKND